METLYDITERYQTVLSMMEEDGEDEVLKETLDAIEGEFEGKADNIVGMIKALELNKGSLNGQRQVFEKEVQALKDKETAIDNKIAWLKKYLCDAMIALDKPKFKTDKFSFWTKKTSGAVVIDGIVPMEFLKVPEPQPDKTAIKKAIDSGEKFTWAHLESHDIAQFR